MISKALKAIKILFWDPHQIKYLIKGVAASFEHRAVIKTLGISVLVDVGANKGQFSLLAKTLFPSLKVFAFEPLQEPRKTYLDIFINHKGLNIYPYAIGESSSVETIHVSKKMDSSSLLPISELQGSIYPGTEESHVEKIEVRRLENVLSSDDITGVSLLKIDVQGFELSVLNGSKELMPQFTYAYIECSYIELYEGQALVTEILEFMIKAQFELIGIYNTSYSKNGSAVQSDFLFRNKSS